MTAALITDYAADRQTPSAVTWRSVSALKLNTEGVSLRGMEVAEETPLAIQYNGVPHAVMMGTPLDLEDFAIGFSVAEGIISGIRDLKSIATTPQDDAITIDITLAPEALHRCLARRRVRALRGHTSCGICGIEDLAQLAPNELPRVRPTRPLDCATLYRAAERLHDLQPLATRTHGSHAAAWVDPEGELLLVREDVGRHNALDKLVGAALRDNVDFICGFCLITSRCSYEMVQKAVVAGISALVAVSAPTALAIRVAQAAGLTLIKLDRDRNYLVYAAPDIAA